MTWELKRTLQCAKCPWIVGNDPREIPDGYCETKHRALAQTIATPGALNEPSRPAMACHETDDAHCVGWLMHQLGPGNNIALRMRAFSCENIDAVRLRGEQHARFQDTYP